MNIILNNYVIEQSEDRFTLYKRREIEKTDKNGNKIIKGTCLGYDMSLSYCLKKMVLLNLVEKDETVSMIKFMDLFSQEVNNITKEIEGITNPKKYEHTTKK
jgi:hypothetical protein